MRGAACPSLGCPWAEVRGGALGALQVALSRHLYQAGDTPGTDPVLGLGQGHQVGFHSSGSPGPSHTTEAPAARPTETPLPAPPNPAHALTRSDQPTEVTESPSTERSQSRVTWGKENGRC